MRTVLCIAYIMTLLITHNIIHWKQRVASPLRLELFHNVQKVVVDLRLVAKLQFHLVQVGQSIFHLQYSQNKCQGHQKAKLVYSYRRFWQQSPDFKLQTPLWLLVFYS